MDQKPVLSGKAGLMDHVCTFSGAEDNDQGQIYHPQMSHLGLTCCPQSCWDIFLNFKSCRNMGVYFYTFSSAVGLGRECVFAELIRPCNKSASRQLACPLSSPLIPSFEGKKENPEEKNPYPSRRSILMVYASKEPQGSMAFV